MNGTPGVVVVMTIAEKSHVTLLPEAPGLDRELVSTNFNTSVSPITGLKLEPHCGADDVPELPVGLEVLLQPHNTRILQNTEQSKIFNLVIILFFVLFVKY